MADKTTPKTTPKALDSKSAEVKEEAKVAKEEPKEKAPAVVEKKKDTKQDIVRSKYLQNYREKMARISKGVGSMPMNKGTKGKK